MSSAPGESVMASRVWKKAGYAVVAMIVSYMVPSTSFVQASPVHTGAMISDWDQVRLCRCASGFKQLYHVLELDFMKTDQVCDS
jgi:hypothetical protein